MSLKLESVGRRDFHFPRFACRLRLRIGSRDLGWNPGTGEVGSVLQTSVVGSTQGLFRLESEVTTVVIGSPCRTRLGVSGPFALRVHGLSVEEA